MNSKLLIVVALSFTLAACKTHHSGQFPNNRAAADNKALVSEFFRYFSAGDIDAAFTLVSDDVTWWVPGNLPFSGTKTKTEYLQVVGAIKQGFPDGLQLTVSSMIAEGSKVAAEVKSHGNHANGKTYSNTYHFLITLDKGQIVTVKEYMDTLHLFQLIQP